MSIKPLPLVIAPDPRLLQKSQEVPEVNEEIRELMNRMFETMYQNRGIGLAAIQVGVLKRVIVVDVEHEKDENGNITNKQQYFMANAVILQKSQNLDCFEEGCLSFPGQNVSISRPNEITVEYLDYNNTKQVLNATGMLAKCIQHEIDHTNGISISEHASALKRKLIFDRLLKFKKQNKLDSANDD